MDYKYIEQLLERYWEGETTLQEEAILRTFFLCFACHILNDLNGKSDAPKTVYSPIRPPTTNYHSTGMRNQTEY